jgi:hypothetical protein
MQGKEVTLMTVTLNLDPETVRRLREKATRRGQTLEAYLEQLAAEPAAGSDTAAERSAAEWVAEFQAWAASHLSLPQLADDSRESIYADRGE